MRISKIDQRRYDFGDGLGPLLLDGLKKVVVLSGPNGSGKSRVLSRLHNLDGCLLDGRGNESLLHQFWPENTVEGLCRPNLNSFIGHDKGRTNVFSLGVFHVLGANRTPNVDPMRTVGFVSQALRLRDPYNETRSVATQLARQATEPGASHLSESTLAYIEQTQLCWWNARHPDYDDPQRPPDLAVEEYERLRDLLRIVLKVELSRDANGRATMFGKPIIEAALSDGQRALLQWCVALHAQGQTLRDMILLMDEPENHLHPEAMIDTVSRIIDAATDGQVWIATHSVPLLAALFHHHPDEVTLFFMDQGMAYYSGRSPEKVLNSLMGGEKNVQALREFVDLPTAFASSRFAAECLFSPTVVTDNNPDDPQVLVAGAAIFQAPDSNERAKILDFGAGHGRLIESLAAGIGVQMQERLDYVAWDISPGPDARCLAAIDRVYGTHDSRWFNEANALAAVHSPHSFDAVVMCNVLHEIEPRNWVGVFEAAGVLTRSLKENGKLVIVEDYLMPKGEYAHPYGFIVLDTAALQTLFRSGTEADSIQIINTNSERYRDRIRAHVVPVHLLRNVNGDTIKAALDFAIRNAEDQISRLRQRTANDYRSGQAHAFWVQQFTNATLARKAFG